MPNRTTMTQRNYTYLFIYGLAGEARSVRGLVSNESCREDGLPLWNMDREARSELRACEMLNTLEFSELCGRDKPEQATPSPCCHRVELRPLDATLASLGAQISLKADSKSASWESSTSPKSQAEICRACLSSLRCSFFEVHSPLRAHVSRSL